MEVPLPLTFLELRFLVSELHEHAFVLSSLLLELCPKVLILVLYLAYFLIWEVDCAQYVRL